MDLKFPILFGVAQVLRGERSPRDGMQELMLMPIRTEMFDWGGQPNARTMFPKVPSTTTKGREKRVEPVEPEPERDWLGPGG